ncbi:CU044_2847 family protein [Streptomyces sp. NPDC014636]|uniref:CU044_2847 family protein n=1 Tax=Streptomyces sp. NPDC014636 TaxID=3364876 RepID=UPI0036F9B21E
MAGGVERVRLDDGTVVWARIGAVDEEALDEGGYWDTGLGGRVIDMAEGLAGTVGGVVRSLRAGLDAPTPVEVSVSFGIELTAQSGKIVSAIAEGGGTSSLTVSLTWTEPATATDGANPAERGDGVVPPQSPAPGVV